LNSERWKEIVESLAKARELADGERESYFSELESRSPTVAAKVRDMLASGAHGSEFLEPPRHGATEAPMRLLTLDFRGMKLGEFELVREIGRGASGLVYLAEQPSLKRQVAIKILVPQLSNVPRVQERFEREALAASRLRHPSIVGVLAFGERNGLLYLAMEYVEGRSIHQHLEALRVARKQQRPPGKGTLDVSKPEVAVELTAQIAEALRYCHGKGVLHRDIKPQNILIDTNGKPRIVDFGLAKDVRAEGLTEAGLVSGTLHYMSPEQALARTNELDARTDLYSLGVVLYEMLTLRRPFEARTDADLVHKVLNSRPIPPHHLDERIPKPLSAICMRALRKSPEGRYEDAGEFIDDLRGFLAGQRIALGVRLRFEDTYRFVFIKRPWLGAAALICLAGTILVIAPKAHSTFARETDADSSAPAQKHGVEGFPDRAKTPEERRNLRKAQADIDYNMELLRAKDQETSIPPK